GFREEFAAAARGALSPFTNLAATMFRTGQDYPGIGYWITRQAVNKVIDHLIPFGKTLEGGEKRRRVVEIANQQVGISGTPNKFTAPFFNAAWCGMFVDWVFKKAGVHGALSKVRHGWTPLVANYTTLPKVPLGQALPGDLPLYRSDAGHINILTDPAKRQTVGGNESNAVRRRIGYVNSASSIRRPDFQGYAQGGIVDAAAGLAGLRDLVWQDAVETPFTTAGEQHLREVLARPPRRRRLAARRWDRHQQVRPPRARADPRPVAGAPGEPRLRADVHRRHPRHHPRPRPRRNAAGGGVLRPPAAGGAPPRGPDA